MRFSQALVPTVKESPSDASNVSHVLLTRAGYVRRVGAGLYDFLPLGVRALHRISEIIRQEMDGAGALEVLMPAMLPAEYFQESGRWDGFGDTLLRFKDRKGADYHLGPTHEEIVTDIARREIRSYRDLPKNLYQVQTKFRDEARPRGGLLRCREFTMKDAYSFDVTEDAAKQSYERMRAAYTRIFDRLGLRYRMVAADSGAMGGSTSAEFQALVDSGEDAIVACDRCDYAANVEVAKVRVEGAEAKASGKAHELTKVKTPGHGAIEDAALFLNVSPKQMLKSLLYLANREVVMVVVRGDHSVNESRLARAVGADQVHLAGEADVKKATGAAVGFAGPVGFKGKVLVDRSAAAVDGGVTGANETDHHLTGVVHGRDYDGELVDVRLAASGDPCPNCDGTLTLYKGIEAGHIFILGTHYSEKMGAHYLDEKQEKKPVVMGCYGIGVSRLIATVVEQHHDDNGIIWPLGVAPYAVHLCTIGKGEAAFTAAEKLYADLSRAGVSVLWDDRDERPGVKFKDADLIGMPLRVTVGEKGLAGGKIELKWRREPDAKKVELIDTDAAAERIRSLVAHSEASTG